MTEFSRLRGETRRPALGDPPNAQVEYWRRQLIGATSCELPTDYPRSSLQAFRSLRQLSSCAEPTVKVRAFSATYGATVFVTLLSVFCALLQRHSGQTDLLIAVADDDHVPRAVGAPDDDPPRDLPFRAEVAPGRPFLDLLYQVGQSVAGALKNQDHSLHELLAALGSDIELPWPHIRFTYRRAPFGAADLGADRSQMLVGDRNFDVALTVEEIDGSLRLQLDCDATLFAEATAARFLNHYSMLLSAAMEGPDLPVSAVRLRGFAPPAGTWDLAIPANYEAPAPPGSSESLVDRFDSVVAAHADRVAVRGPSGESRYSDLSVGASHLAGRIASVVGDTGRVALLCAHDIGLAVAVWGVLKAGAAYVPLDPRHPNARLTETLLDAPVDAIVCDGDLAARAGELAPDAVVVVLSDAGPDDAKSGGTPSRAESESLAYLLYTSGSTGHPKGVMQTHRNVLAHALVYASRLRIGPRDRIPLLARYTFDAAVMDLFGALLTGASLHIVDPYADDGRALRASLAEIAPTILHCTPTLFRYLLSGMAEHGTRSAALASVRAVVLGGEEVTRDDLASFHRLFPRDCAFVNGLGPTECTVALQHRATMADLVRSSVPIGFGVEGVDVHLVDAEGHDTEVFGELELRTSHVALGYWNRPELTAATFGKTADGIPFYRTGDLARRLPSGELVFCGRKDRQVKIRGHRVEPAESEALLRAHPTVAQAAVVVDRDRSRGPRLIGYVTSSTLDPAESEELMDYLRRQLPDYAVPSQVVVMEALPTGPTGKLDRWRLPVPDVVDRPASDDAPRTEIEQAVARYWCDVLGLTAAGVRDNFMRSGGDSLQILDLLARLRSNLGIECSLQQFLAAPTIETLASASDRPSQSGTQSDGPGL